MKEESVMFMLDLSYLLGIRRKAIRSGIWFKALTKSERAILDLIPRCVDKLRSPKLIDIVAKIIVKVKNALKSPVISLMEQIGRPLAKRLSRIAQRWGNKTAKEWAEDQSFIRYLTITKMNDIPAFRCV